jgi:antirestriction protein ArdC
MEDTTLSKDVYSIATDRIIALLQQGTVPWKKPWTDAGLPQNLISRTPYRGINLWLLNSCGYPQNLFLTFKQVKALKGSVKKDAKAHPVLFWKWTKKDRKDPRPIEQIDRNELKALLRYYLVFNIDQCTGIPTEMIPSITKPNKPLEAAEAILNGMSTLPPIVHEEQRAFYLPAMDIINMPKMETFVNSEGYYATLFHEVVHSTGHMSRLNRPELMAQEHFGSENYSMEELVAEFGASYLSSHAGIVIDDYSSNASYIDGWLSVLKKDKRFIVYASGQAQKAVEYILNHH